MSSRNDKANRILAALGPFPFHVFAHSGERYCTIACSPGISLDDRRLLEQFFFGQSNDAAYLESLRDEPGLIWRPVGDRVAITRVRAGQPDANGRATLAFETVLLDSASVDTFLRQLPSLMRGEWSRSELGVTITAVRATDRPGRPPCETASVLLGAIRDGKRLVTPADSLALEDLIQVLAAGLTAPSFSLAYKALNERAPTQITLVAGNRRTTHAAARSREDRMTILPSSSGASRPVRASVSGVGGLAVLTVLNTLILSWIALRPTAGVGGAADLENNLKNSVVHEREQVTAQLDAAKKELAELRALVESRATTDDLTKARNELDGKLAANGDSLKTLGDEAKQRDEAHTAKVDELRKQLEGLPDTLKQLIEMSQKIQTATAALQGEQIVRAVEDALKELKELVPRQKFKKGEPTPLDRAQDALRNILELAGQKPG